MMTEPASTMLTHPTPAVALIDGVRAVGNALGLEGGIVFGATVLAIGLYIGRFRSTAGAIAGTASTATTMALVALVTVGVFLAIGSWRGWLDVSATTLTADLGRVVEAAVEILLDGVRATADSLGVGAVEVRR